MNNRSQKSEARSQKLEYGNISFFILYSIFCILLITLASCGGGKEIKSLPEGQRRVISLINQGHKYYIDGNLSKALGIIKMHLN